MNMENIKKERRVAMKGKSRGTRIFSVVLTLSATIVTGVSI
jgi:hypothetical protein